MTFQFYLAPLSHRPECFLVLLYDGNCHTHSHGILTNMNREWVASDLVPRILSRTKSSRENSFCDFFFLSFVIL